MKSPSRIESEAPPSTSNVGHHFDRQSHWLISTIEAIVKAWKAWFKPGSERLEEGGKNEEQSPLVEGSSATSFSSSSSALTVSGLSVTHSGFLGQTSLDHRWQSIVTSGVGFDNFMVMSGVRTTRFIHEPEPAGSSIDTHRSTVLASGQKRMAVSGIFEARSALAISGPPKVQPLHKIVPYARKQRLLWVGDAVVPTGFATVTHSILKYLSRDWDVMVSGINYDGSAHTYPYQILPANRGGDMWGIKHFTSLCAEVVPDVVVINNDWWNVAQFARVQPAKLPVIGYMPVDGGNLDRTDMAALEKLSAAVWYTDFGLNEARKAGFRGANHIIPHGIDTTAFTPINKSHARHSLGLNIPPNAFVVGNLNRNQPRKRLDLTIQIFADWVQQHRIQNAWLLMHCAQHDCGWNLRRVAAFYGVEHCLLLTGGADMRHMQDVSTLQAVYNSLDVQISTTLGEGWGLTTMEGMACGIPQIVPEYAALAEWAEPALKVPCSRVLMHPETNTVGALVDGKIFVKALHSLYQDSNARQQLSVRGCAHVRQPRFHWHHVAKQFHNILKQALADGCKNSRVTL